MLKNLVLSKPVFQEAQIPMYYQGNSYAVNALIWYCTLNILILGH